MPTLRLPVLSVKVLLIVLMYVLPDPASVTPAALAITRLPNVLVPDAALNVIVCAEVPFIVNEPAVLLKLVNITPLSVFVKFPFRDIVLPASASVMAVLLVRLPLMVMLPSAVFVELPLSIMFP